MVEVDLVMFLMDVKLKNKQTSLKRRPISKAMMSGRYRFILPKLDGRKISKLRIHMYINIYTITKSMHAF